MLLRLGVWLLLPVAALAQTHSTYGDPHLAELIADALERNPQVREAFAHYQAARARVPQATALPDPMLSVTQHARTPETRVGPQTTLVSVSQRFPWFGKLSDQGKLAAKRASVQAELYEARRAEVVRQLKLAYFDLRYIDQALVIAGEETELLEHYETLAQARYSQGAGLQQSVVKLQAEITRLLNRTRELERQRVDAESVLNTLRDRQPDEPIAPATPTERPNVLPEAEELYAVGREHRPEITAAFLQIETEEKAIHPRGGNTIPTSPSGRRGAM
ncbi:MAG: TolC family protein [Bryobacterales bacterium]